MHFAKYLLPLGALASGALASSSAGLDARKVPEESLLPEKNTEHVETEGYTKDQAFTGKNLRILPLGTSITYGSASTDGNGYRKTLRDLITPAGNKVEYVGGVKSGDMDNNCHEGHPGWSIKDVAIYGRGAAAEKPNVILLFAGTSDIIQNNDVDNAPERLATMVDELNAICNDTLILVAQSTLLGDTKKSEQIKKFNAALPALIEERSKKGMHVSLVDFESTLQTGTADYSDKDCVNPSDAGYAKIAHGWYSALVKAADWINEPADVEESDAVSSNTDTATTTATDTATATGTGNEATATGTGKKATATGTDNEATATGTDDEVTATGTGKKNTATGTGKKATATGTDNEATATGTDDEATATGTDNEATATGTGKKATATGTDKKTTTTAKDAQITEGAGYIPEEESDSYRKVSITVPGYTTLVTKVKQDSHTKATEGSKTRPTGYIQHDDEEEEEDDEDSYISSEQREKIEKELKEKIDKERKEKHDDDDDDDEQTSYLGSAHEDDDEDEEETGYLGSAQREQREKERKEKEQREKEQREKERKEKEQREKEQKEKERKEREQREREQQESEQEHSYLGTYGARV